VLTICDYILCTHSLVLQPCIEVTTFRIQNENLFANGVIVGKRNGLTTCSACCGGPLCNTGGCFQLVSKYNQTSRELVLVEQ
jgi:hypothetical protein